MTFKLSEMSKKKEYIEWLRARDLWLSALFLWTADLRPGIDPTPFAQEGNRVDPEGKRETGIEFEENNSKEDWEVEGLQQE